MKSCKKLTALLLALILTFAVFSCVFGVSAESYETTTLAYPTGSPDEETPSNANPEDLTHTNISIPPTSADFDPSAIASEYSEEIEDVNNALDNGSSFIKDFLNRMNELLEGILNFFKSLSGGFPLGDIFK